MIRLRWFLAGAAAVVGAIAVASVALDQFDAEIEGRVYEDPWDFADRRAAETNSVRSGPI